MISLFVPDRNADVWKNGWEPIGTGFGMPTFNQRSLAGPQVTEESALGISAIFACTRALAQTLAMLPAISYFDLGDGERERAGGEYLYDLLKDAPNPEMDSMTFWEMMAANNINLGNGYAEKELNRLGETVYLWPIHPSRVKPQRNKAKQLEFLVRGNTAADDVIIPAAQMLNVVGALSPDGITAPGIIRKAIQSCGKAIALDRFTSAYWGNGAKPGGALKLLEDMELEDRERLRRDWITMHQGVESAGKVAILPKEVDWKEFPLSNEQSQLIQSLQFSVEDLARWYGVPPHVIGHLLHATIANVEQEQIGWRQRAILPLAVRFERALKRQVMPKGMYIEWLLDMIERADSKTRAEANEVEIRSGQTLLNEVRRRENRPKYQGFGDEPLFAMNYTTLSRIESGESLKNNINQAPKVEIVTPPKLTEAEPKTDTNQAQQLAAQTAKAWLDDSWLRLVRREQKQAEKNAVEAKKFCQWLDTYGEQHAALIVESITTPVTSWLSAMHDAREPLVVAASLAQQHVTASRELLLSACEVQPESLQSSVTACVATWETRTVSLSQLQG